MFNKSEQQSVLDALELSGIEYSSIQFYGNDRVTIYQEIEDSEVLFLAECGIFAPLKDTAINIWDTLGTEHNDRDEDIEFFIVWIDKKPFAKFVIFPDLVRTLYNSVIHEQPRTNWNIDRSELLLEIGIEVEDTDPIEVEFDEVVTFAVKLHFIGRNEKQATRIFMIDLLSLIGVKNESNYIHSGR